MDVAGSAAEIGHVDIGAAERQEAEGYGRQLKNKLIRIATERDKRGDIEVGRRGVILDPEAKGAGLAGMDHAEAEVGDDVDVGVIGDHIRDDFEGEDLGADGCVMSVDAADGDGASGNGQADEWVGLVLNAHDGTEVLKEVGDKVVDAALERAGDAEVSI